MSYIGFRNVPRIRRFTSPMRLSRVMLAALAVLLLLFDCAQWSRHARAAEAASTATKVSRSAGSHSSHAPRWSYATRPPSTARQEPEADAAARAQALLDLSMKQNVEDHALALETARESLALWQTTSDKAGLAGAYAQVGRCYMAQSELAEATQNYQLALQLRRELNDPVQQSEVLIMLGYIEHRKGEFASALSFFYQARGLVEQLDEPKQLGQIALGLADVFNDSGMPEYGLAQYQQGLEFFRRTPETLDDALTTSYIGNTYYLLGKYPEALDNLKQALAGLEPGSIYAALCQQYLGKVYVATGQYDAALEQLQGALGIYNRTINPKEAAQVRALMGQVYQQQGRLDRSGKYYEEALKTFTHLSDRVDQAAVYSALGQLELKGRRYDAAQDYLQRSIEATEELRRVPASGDLTAAFSATVQDRYEAYIECLMSQHQLRPSQSLNRRAFEISELARARSLAELLRATETNLAPGLDPELSEREKTLRQTLRAKEDYELALRGQRNARKLELDQLDAELSRLKAEYEEVTETIRARYPSYEQATRPAAWTLRQIQEQVITDDQTVLLEYNLGPNKSYVWAVTRGRIESYELAAQPVIDAAAQKVYELLANPPDAGDAQDQLNFAVGELSRLVLAPIAPELDRRRIIVVADGALNYIPFQIMQEPGAGGEPLVARYEVVNAPSATILGELRQEASRHQPRAKLLAAFGDPVFRSSYAEYRGEAKGGGQFISALALPAEHWRRALRDIELNGDAFDPAVIRPLFFARAELLNLSRLADESETLVAADFAATREKLLHTDLSQFSILHFATHGLLDPKRPENSGIVLSTVNLAGQEQDGFVGLRDIYELHAPVDLVVLSACQTALGKDVRGEGLLGLTRGFMYAGASSVVASLWKVEDEATLELMKRFYANMLQQGMPPAEALRAAQNSIRQNPRWRSPYYWAAFTLQGEYARAIKPAPVTSAVGSYRNLMLGCALLTLLPGIGWWYRRRRSRRRFASGKP